MAPKNSRSTERPTTTIISISGKPVGLRLRQIVLVVVDGPDVGTSVALAGRQLGVGSHASTDLTLTDPAVSRFHFRVVADDRGYRLIDSGSTNGTFINGIRVDRAYLADGAQIHAGNTRIAVRFGHEDTDVELSAEHSFGGLVGRSLRMREVFATARRAAATEAPVLLFGETGTGKDVLAHAIHDHSHRAGGPFIVFDCTATPATLLESVLFGHVRGAFTSAEHDHTGVFARASGGTLFLDEIGELPLALQPKLLRALDGSAITPVGGTTEVPVNVRIVTATNRDLRDMVSNETFRADLYYRLAVMVIELPPLRERAEDIPLLSGAFLRDVSAWKGRDPTWLQPHLDEAFSGLSRHHWPGNVRELRNVIERAVALTDVGDVSTDALARLVELRDTVTRTMRGYLPLQKAREQFDREYVRDVVLMTGGDLKRAAEIAQIHPKSIERLMRRYGVERP